MIVPSPASTRANNSAGLIEVIVSTSFPAAFQAANPPFKYPMVKSYPTRAKRVITSSSRPSSVTIKISCLMSGIIAPTHGAKDPSIPMLIEFGINPAAKSCGSRVSKIKAPVSFAATSNPAGVKACCPRSITLSMESYP